MADVSGAFNTVSGVAKNALIFGGLAVMIGAFFSTGGLSSVGGLALNGVSEAANGLSTGLGWVSEALQSTTAYFSAPAV